MLQKKLIFFISIFCFYCVDTYAKNVSLPVDTVALEAALSQINIIYSGNTDESAVASAKADLYLYFMENKDKKLSSKKIVTQCKNIIGNSISCMNFIDTYNSYLDHANFCLKANNFTVMYNGTETSFKDCYRYLDNNWHNRDGSVDINLNNPDDGKYKGTSRTGQCKQWITAAENCAQYLEKFYYQKLETEKKDENKKKTYRCVIEKIQTGEISFPLDREKLENNCDDEYQGRQAVYMFEALGY